MNKLALLSAAIFFLIASAANGLLHPESNLVSPQADQYTPSLIIKFANPNPAKAVSTARISEENLNSIKRLNNSNGIQSIKSFSPSPGSNGETKQLKGVYILTASAGSDIEQIADEYRSLPNIEYAEIDQMAIPHFIPSDYYYAHQWNLNNTGQAHYAISRREGHFNDKLILTTGIPDADIDIAEVYYNVPDLTAATVVAIIDTGVDTDHPDLATSIWINQDEIKNNGIDDDHNGYIDDYKGWDFSSSESILEIELEDNDPTDYYGHGSHCAGIVAGLTNNGIGITGVTTACRIMPLKVFPYPIISKLARAIIYAADNGADVINMSLGYEYRSFLLEDAIDYAKSKGVVVCASTGNTGANESNYPAGFDNVIAVGSSNDSDHVSVFSTFGDHIDLVAPGEGILSLRADSTDMYGDFEPNVHIFRDYYYMASGTSMSCPHVVGAAAFIRSMAPGLKPDLVKQILEESATDLVDPYGNGQHFDGWDIYSGYGRISVAGAMAQTPKNFALIDSPRAHDIISGEIEIWGRAFIEDDLLTDYVVEYGEGGQPESWTVLTESSSWIEYDRLAVWETSEMNGKYTLRLRVGETSEWQTTIFIANESRSEIKHPQNGDTVSNFVNVSVDAYSPNYREAVLEYGTGANPDEFIELARSTELLGNEIISDWLVETLGEGEYTLRLTVINVDGSTLTDEISIFARSSFYSDNAWRTEIGLPIALSLNYGDFDNNGEIEVIAGTLEGIKFIDPDGNMGVENMPDIPPDSFMAVPAVGDVDGDGVDDIVALCINPAKISIFPSSGNARDIDLNTSIEPSIYYRTEHELDRVYLRDIDGDSADEVFCHYRIDGVQRIVLYDYFDDIAIAIDSASEIQPADLDGDNLDEIYYYSEKDLYLKRMNSSGQTIDSLAMDFGYGDFSCEGISALDLDGDSKHELAVFGRYPEIGYWLYLFDEQFSLKPGFPHELNIRNYVTPTMPIFADLDNDGVAEYLTTYFGVTYSFILVWNLDGSPFLDGSGDGFFATIPRPGVLNMMTVADLNGDDRLDIIAVSNDDLFFSYRPQRIYAWDYSGQLLENYPFIVNAQSELGYYGDYRFTPIIADLNADNSFELIMPSSDESVINIGFSESIYESCKVPIPNWRYNRRLNNIGSIPSCQPVDVTDDEVANLLPSEFSLSQNYPNPFNPSTIIEYALPEKSDVSITVYNIRGQLVKRLIDQTQSSGAYSVVWDGTDNNLNIVAAGVYFYQIKTESFVESRKMVLIK